MFVFDDSESYNHFTAKHKIGSPGSGGSFNRIDTENVILVFNQGFTYNVPHEVTHALEYCNSNDRKLLSEGRAQYIQMLQKHELYASTLVALYHKISGITNELIAKSCYLNKDKNQFNDYILCAAVEAYLAEHNQNTFQTVLNDPVHGPGYLASKINLHDFKSFVETKATPAYMKKINALPVQCDKEIYAYQDRYGNQMHVSKAVIQTNDGPVVASPISTTLYANSIRTTLADRKFYMDIDLEYRYLKLVIYNGKKALVFCNKDGQKFSDTIMYQNEVQYITDNKKELTAEQKQNIKYDLTYLRPNNDLLQYDENTIFETKFPTNSKLAVKYKASILHDGTKITELSTAEIFCMQENNGRKYVIFRDPINEGQSVHPDGSAYLGLVGGKDIYLLSSIPHKDEYVTENHVHYKPSFRMNPKDTFAPDKLNNHPEKLMLQNVIVKNDGEAEETPPNSENSHSLYLERGKLLDNRGSDATHDDRYEVLLKNANNGKNATLSKESYHIIAYMGKNGKFTDKVLVIEQHGSTHRFQFPSEIDSLKLKTLGDSIVLVPCNKDGQENVLGMPKITDALRQIPADHLYTFKNPVHSPSRIVATGISNLSSDEDGTIFKIEIDPEAEKKCAPGHTCASYPVIQESSTNKTIGILPSNYNIYVDNTFNSINPNAAPEHQVYQQPSTVLVEHKSKDVFEIQQSKTAITNSNPANIVPISDSVKQYSRDAVDVPPSNSHIGKRSVDVVESHRSSDLYNQRHSDDVYSHYLFGESYDSNVSI